MQNEIELWIERISHWPLPLHVRQRVNEYAKALEGQGLPVLFEFTHLADTLTIQSDIMADLVNRTEECYREYLMPKKRGGERKISIPSPTLLFVQRWIYEEILTKCELHDAAYGFVRRKNIVDNAKIHLGCKCLLKMDLKDFFPSISIKRVISVFNHFGYVPNVSYYLSKLCCLNGMLPQGAATSPQLSNIIAKRLDFRLSGLCKKLDFTYTRYADDIFISGDKIGFNVINWTKKIVLSEGFLVNEGKTVIVRGNGKKIVTGISVSGDRLTVPRAYKREICQHIHFIRKYGVEGHMDMTGQQDPVYLDRIRGKIQFWLQVEPENEFANAAVLILDDEDKKLASFNIE